MWTVRLIFLGSVLAMIGRTSIAQETLKITEASGEYDVTIRVEACGGSEHENDPDRCTAEVSFFRKGAQAPFQVLGLPEIWINRKTVAYNPRLDKKPRVIYDDEYTLVFDDFNFDGKQDLAICNGRNGGYGGPSYTIYLYDTGAGQFVRSRSLSKLNEGVYLGLFYPDSKKKLLTAFSKSGCCYHETEMYRVMNNRPLLVEKVTEDARGRNAAVIITTRKLVGGQWIKRVKREKSGQSPDT